MWDRDNGWCMRSSEKNSIGRPGFDLGSIAYEYETTVLPGLVKGSHSYIHPATSPLLFFHVMSLWHTAHYLLTETTKREPVTVDISSSSPNETGVTDGCLRSSEKNSIGRPGFELGSIAYEATVLPREQKTRPKCPGLVKGSHSYIPPATHVSTETVE